MTPAPPSSTRTAGSLERDLLAGGARALRRRRPGDRLAPPPRARRTLIVAQALARRGRELERLELVAATQGPGLVGALLVGLSTAKALAAAPRAAVRARRSPAGARRRELPALDGASARRLRAAVRLPDRQRRSHAAGARARARRLRRARPHARRRRRRGVRQGRADARPRLPRRRRARAPRRRGRSRGVRLPRLARRARARAGAAPPGLRAQPRLLLRGPEDGAALHASRALRGEVAASARADLAASYQAAIVDSLVERAERALEQTGLDRLAVGGGVAANGELRARLGELDASCTCPQRVLCTDNAAMIASAARFGERLATRDYLGARRVRHRRASSRAADAPCQRSYASTPSPTAISAPRRWPRCAELQRGARLLAAGARHHRRRGAAPRVFRAHPRDRARRRGAVRVLRRRGAPARASRVTT